MKALQEWYYLDRCPGLLFGRGDTDQECDSVEAAYRDCVDNGIEDEYNKPR